MCVLGLLLSTISVNKIHLLRKRCRLKIHHNNQFLLSVDISVSIRDLRQKKLVLVLPVLGWHDDIETETSTKSKNWLLSTSNTGK